MSSPAFSELHGINGMAVAKRCELLASPENRQLIWFIQGISLLKGGCKTLAEGLLKMFPERIGTRTMHRLGKGKGQRYTGEEASEIKEAIADRRDITGAPLLSGAFLDSSVLLDDAPLQAPVDYGPPVPCQSLYAKCLEAARERLPDFLTEVCINPALQFWADEAGGDELDSRSAQVGYFQDIIGALFEYKRRYEDQARAEFCHTAISRKIWKQLDDALKTKSMILIDGLEGRGKTEALRAWCNCHLGAARFVSLKGITTKTAQFSTMAQALGVCHGNSRKASEMQASVEDVLRASELMLTIDEAHHCFNQGPRMYTRPEMLDWIDTSLCNPPLPVALITTPQFLICMERAAGQVEWNYRQFRRRCKRYTRLPQKNTPADIEAVACKLLPGADKPTIKQVIAYEALCKRDLSAVGDVVREAKLLAEEEGASKVTFEHVKRAIYEVLIVSDVPWAEMEKRLQHRKLGRKAPRQALTVEPEGIQEPPETRGRDILPRLSPGAASGNRMRFREPVAAPDSEPVEAVLTPG
jgi:DNA transposition AAA+ family ATPase